MKCPSCAAESGDGAECPVCGLIFAKWRERQEREKREALEALEGLPVARKAAPDPRARRAVAGAAVLLWMLSLYFYAIRRAHRGRAPLGEATGIFVDVRDPRTGEMRRLPVRRLGVPAGPPTVPTAPAEPTASGQ